MTQRRRTKQRWWIVPFTLTDETGWTRNRYALLEAPNKSTAAAKLEKRIVSGEKLVWGHFPDNFDGTVREEGGAFYISSPESTKAPGRDEGDHPAVISIMTSAVEARSYPSEDAAGDALDDRLPPEGGYFIGFFWSPKGAIVTLSLPDD